MSLFKEVTSIQEDKLIEKVYPIKREVNIPDSSNQFRAVFEKLGLLPDLSKNKDFDREANKDNLRFLEKGEDGKYYDKVSGRVYDSVEAWKKFQETLIKRYESTAKYHEVKANKEWAHFKNSEENGFSETERWAHYQRSQRYYAKVEECKKKRKMFVIELHSKMLAKIICFFDNGMNKLFHN